MIFALPPQPPHLPTASLLGEVSTRHRALTRGKESYGRVAAVLERSPSTGSSPRTRLPFASAGESLERLAQQQSPCPPQWSRPRGTGEGNLPAARDRGRGLGRSDRPVVVSSRQSANWSASPWAFRQRSAVATNSRDLSKN